MRLMKVAVISGLSVCIGSYAGIEYERSKWKRRENLISSRLGVGGSEDGSPESASSNVLGSSQLWCHHFLPSAVSVVEASSQVPSTPLSSRTDLLFPSQTPGNNKLQRASEIMRHGYPSSDQLKHYDNYVLMYDRRNRNAYWVFEHLTPAQLDRDKKQSDRTKSVFLEDASVHPYFRSTNGDYKNSGYDRGHLAAAGNHRHSQEYMNQTFHLTNISPQVGKGFNRDIWNDLEKYVRSVGRKSRNLYVCTGPLYLPRKDPYDGKQYVKYEVIGKNNVAVPTHFFKVLLIEDNQGEFELQSFVLPNQEIPNGTKLRNFLVPIDSIERAAGFLLFDRLPKEKLRSINGKKI
ncbi:hypothetical protein FSP39_021792 [Pinctada imbricata]|uniref:Endonuclease n=1 Tax=Pinctada imbricata TaxID=66713 RepID=A0AA88XND8_PINIB|nr:hypothetical protein FSP39_021792 [Pinctada imbricata]